MQNTETVTVTNKGTYYEIVVQHDQSGSAYGIDLSNEAYEQLSQHFVSGSLLTEFCKCDEPDRESGFTYCHKCHRHVSNERMDELTKDDD